LVWSGVRIGVKGVRIGVTTVAQDAPSDVSNGAQVPVPRGRLQ
jgi:hypothetical protein